MLHFTNIKYSIYIQALSLIVSFIFIFEPLGYCLPDAQYNKTNLRTPLEFGKKDKFSSRIEAALQNVHRKDRSQEIRDSLKNQEDFLRELKKANVSALDYLIFVSELLFMSRTNPRDEKNLLLMLKRLEYLMSDSPSPSKSLSLANYLSKNVFSDIDRKTSLSNDKKMFHYDVAVGSSYKPIGPVGSLTPEEQPVILHKVLFLDPEAFLLPTLQSAANDLDIKLDDIAYPLKAVHFQSGIKQDVYLILVTLKDKRVVPFTLSVARSTATSYIVRKEFENFKAHFGDPDIIQAFNLISIQGFSAYSSAFENDIAEVQYNTEAMANKFIERKGSFRLTSILPLRSGSFSVPTFFKMVKEAREGTLELPDFSKILRGAVGLITKFYDPETKTMIDDFDMQSGDVNMNDSAHIKKEFGACSIDPSVDLSFKLVAWRGNKTGIDILHFLDYLFGLSYVSGDKEYIVRGKNFDPLIMAGVLEGLKQGLIKKYGLAKGLQETKTWIEMYLSAIDKNLFKEDDLFSKAILKLYLESLDAEIKGSAKRDDFLNKLINQMSPLGPAIEVTDDVIIKAKEASEMYARYKSLLELLRTYTHSSYEDFPVQGRRLHGEVLRRICKSAFIDLEEKVEGLELEKSSDIAAWAQLYPQLNSIMGQIEYHAETAVLSLMNEIKRAKDLIDSLRPINETLASKLKLEFERKKLLERCAKILASDSPDSEYESVNQDVEILKLKIEEAMDITDLVASEQAFRFPKYIWKIFKEKLKELDSKYPGISEIITKYGLAWTGWAGEVQWIDGLLIDKYKERDWETRGYAARNDVWEKAKEAINEANGYQNGDPRYLKNNWQVRVVIGHHEDIHALLKSKTFEGLILDFRKNLERAFNGKLTENHAFIQAIKTMYGEPNISEVSDTVNWYLEEFLTLSIQEQILFNKDARKMFQRLGIENDRAIEITQRTIDDVQEKAKIRDFQKERDSFVVSVMLMEHGGPLNILGFMQRVKQVLYNIRKVINDNRKEGIEQLTNRLWELGPKYGEFYNRAEEMSYKVHDSLHELPGLEKEYKEYLKELEELVADFIRIYREILPSQKEIEQLEPEPKRREWIARVFSEAESMVQNIKALQVFLTQETEIHKEEISLATWLNRKWRTKVIGMPAAISNVSVTIKGDAQPAIEVNPELLHLAIERIISNGFHELIKTGDITKDKVEIELDSRDGNAFITIVSPGHVSQEHLKINPRTGLPNILSLNYLRPNFAHGIALTFVIEAIMKMGGKIEVRNRPDPKSPKVEFIIKFPVTKTQDIKPELNRLLGAKSRTDI